MKVTIGKEGLEKSWQDDFPEAMECPWCEGVAKIGFVAHEGFDEESSDTKSVSSLYLDEGKEGGYWLHDYCAVAVYFCKDCLEITAIYNQA